MVLSKGPNTYESSPVWSLAMNQYDCVTIQQYSTKHCSILKGFSNQKKRTADAAYILDASTKMSRAMLGQGTDLGNGMIPPSKRARVERLRLSQQRISVFEALTSALENVKDNKESPELGYGPNCHLHHACELVTNNKGYIKEAIEYAPHEVSCRSPKFAATGLYSLPLNIALNNKQASVEVLEILLNRNPSISAVNDGHLGSTSLSIALLKRSCDFEIVKLLLQAYPDCIRVADYSHNFPLHVACAQGGAATLKLIKHLHKLCPEACAKKNIHGESPLQIAERNPMCSKDIVNFLRSVSSGEGTVSS